MSDMTLGIIQRGAKGILPSAAKKSLRAGIERLQSASLRLALREQGLWELQERLGRIVPDLKHQYSSFEVDSDFLRLKVRGQHAFQIALATEAIRTIGESKSPLVLVDIGDSAGTHVRYLQELNKHRGLRCVSVNVDEQAVRKVREVGLSAILAPAEDVARQGLSADIFVSFEMLEHLPSPIHSLQSLSEKTTCKAFVVTVPYVAQSRVGLHHIRQNRPDRCTPENTHIFELCPADWRLLFLHAGWSVKKEMLYLQYPRFHALRVMRTLWKRLDFEGFWGAILQRDHTWSAHYGEGA